MVECYNCLPAKPVAVITTYTTVIGALKFTVHQVELLSPVTRSNLPANPVAVITTYTTVIGALKFTVHQVELPSPVKR